MDRIGIGDEYRARCWETYKTRQDKPAASNSVNQAQNQWREKLKEAEDKAETDTEVLVRPDGSRVLLMTVIIGGMSTTMSMKISEPVEWPDETAQPEDGQAGDMESRGFSGVNNP